jgi:heterodisulfide reductase subunit A-like polyferredoxin
LPAGQAAISELLRATGANRLVVAGCSHRTHEPLFQRLMHQAGLNPYLLELVNLREQCAWVHQDDPAGATRQACEQLGLGIARARAAEPIYKQARTPQRAALVVGGGVAGMTSALAIADAGFDVHLVESSGELGGNLHHVYYVAKAITPSACCGTWSTGSWPTSASACTCTASWWGTAGAWAISAPASAANPRAAVPGWRSSATA